MSEEEKNKKKKNTEKTDIIICLKKRNKNLKNIRKNIEKQKSLIIIINKLTKIKAY